MDHANQGSAPSLLWCHIVVCGSAAIVAGVLGSLASSLYRPLFYAPQWRPLVHLVGTIGTGWGAVTGVIAGILWCRWMIAPQNHAHGDKIRHLAVKYGIGAGMLSMVMLHAVLMAGRWYFDLGLLVLGTVFALPSGAILGLICGALFEDTFVQFYRAARSGPAEDAA